MPIGAAAGMAIQGGSGLVGSVFNYFGQKRQGRLNRLHQQNMANDAYSKDVEMWNMQNEYNKPVNQMKRFEEAGLNPNLIYGKGTPGNAQDAPKYNVPKSDYPFQGINTQIPNIINQYQDYRLKKAEGDKIAEITANVALDNSRKKMENEIFGYTAYANRKAQSFRDSAVLDYDVRLREQELEKLANQKGISKMQYEWARMKNQRFQATGQNIDKDNFIQRKIENYWDGATNRLGTYWKQARTKNWKGNFWDLKD